MRYHTPNFSRARNGYDPAAVDEFIGELVHLQSALEREVNDLRNQLTDSSTQLSQLHRETAALAEASPAPQAMTDRIAKMLRIAVDEVSEMQYEARLEAETTLARANEEADATRTQARQTLAELAARQRAMETEYEEVMSRARDEAARIVAQAVSESERMRELEALRRQQAEDELSAELAKLRRETEVKVEEQLRTTAQECEIRLLDAKSESERRMRVANEQIDRRLQETRRVLDEVSQKRISILEQLMEVRGSLESIPAILENAQQEVGFFTGPGLAIGGAVDDLADNHGSADPGERQKDDAQSD